MQLLYGDVVLFGSFAAALAAALVVTRFGWRLAVVAAAALGLWLLRPTSSDAVSFETPALAVIFFGAQLLGLLAGSLLRRWPAGVAAGLALVAASTTTHQYVGGLVAALVAVPFLGVGRGAASILKAAGAAALALVLWLLGAFVHMAASYGWMTVKQGRGAPSSAGRAVAWVLEPAGDFLRTQSTVFPEALARHQSVWLVVGLILALAVITIRLRQVRASAAPPAPVDGGHDPDRAVV